MRDYVINHTRRYCASLFFFFGFLCSICGKSGFVSSDMAYIKRIISLIKKRCLKVIVFLNPSYYKQFAIN